MSFEIENGVLKKYYNDGNTDVVIPEGVKVIGAYAFRNNWGFGCAITSVVIPESVEIIESGTFWGCTNLVSVKLPDNLTQLQSHTFFNCSSLKSINLPHGIEEIPQSLFFGCHSLTNINIPDSVRTISNGAFSDCHALEEIRLPNGLNCISAEAFHSCYTLKSVTVPDSVTEIGYRAFSGCRSLTSASLPANLTAIGHSAFGGCSALTDITIPDGITEIASTTFSNCTSLERVTLPDNINKIGDSAFLSCSALKSVVLPKALRFIRRCAFADCTALTEITLPDTITRIEDNAFHNCTALRSLTLPKSLQVLECSAFSGCTALEQITLPTHITSIEERTFENCSALTSLSVPANIRTIANSAFKGCTNLRRVILPNADITIGQTAFDACPNITCEVTGGINLRTTEKLPTGLTSLNIDASDEDRVYVLIHQSAKAWQTWAAKSAQNPDAVIEACINMLAAEKKILTALCKQIVAFMLECESNIKPETIVKMIDLLKSKKCKVDTEQFRSISSLLAGENATDVHPIEAFVQEQLKDITLCEEAASAVKKGTKVHYASGDGIVSHDALRLLLHETVTEWHRRKIIQSGEFVEIETLSPASSAVFSETAEKIASALNRAELSAFLATLTKQLTKYRLYMLAHTRFADEAEAQNIISQISKNTRGKAAQRNWAENMTTALMHSDTRTAMLYFDKQGKLDEYAKVRGMSSLEMRDSRMMPEFAFDADGVKRYDIGGNTIEVTIESDLSFRLFDVKKGKVVRSIPKKSDDPEKAAACAENLKAFKKEVLDFYKLRTRYMHDLHLGGDALSNELWHRVYLNHPVLKYLTRLLVWQDETKKSFMPLEEGIIDYQGNPYAPQGKITLAHVLSMSADEIAAWQKYLTEHSLVQPFGQMWEPVVQFDAAAPDFKKRYDDVVLTKEERSALKKSLAAWGINMRSDSMEREFDARQWSYAYSNSSTFTFDGYVRLDYEVDPDKGITTLGRIDYCSKKAQDSARLNAIFLHLDRAAIRSHIMAGNDQTVATALTADYTLAQINEFIDLSTEHGQTACTALLLKYKNEHFADFGEIDEFSLDW